VGVLRLVVVGSGMRIIAAPLPAALVTAAES